MDEPEQTAKRPRLGVHPRVLIVLATASILIGTPALVFYQYSEISRRAEEGEMGCRRLLRADPNGELKCGRIWSSANRNYGDPGDVWGAAAIIASALTGFAMLVYGLIYGAIRFILAGRSR